MGTDPASLRYLVACSGCRRQFDASGLAQGSRFHCACGEIVEVPHFVPQDAAVVRCSSCSAPRAQGTAACRHCGADYTLHEQDMHTLCPACMTRLSDRARFCHNCAVPITPAGDAGSRSSEPCPACGERHKLNTRTLGDPAVTLLECVRCAGLWLGPQAFEVMADRAREQVVPEKLLQVGSASSGSSGARSAGFYRKCPACGKMMNRRNFGHGSGVVVDICKEHGLWFDARELETILSWIKRGGEARVRSKLASDRAQSERAKRFRVDATAKIDRNGNRVATWRDPSDMVSHILAALFDL